MVDACEEPAVLLPRRAGLRRLRVRPACGRPGGPEALKTAREGTEVPADDVRSRVVASLVLARALAATGHRGQARAVAAGAMRAAYATQQLSERPAADALVTELSG